MKFTNTATLKNQTNAILREAERGQLWIITRRGKPVAALRSCTEDELEDIVLETHQDIRRSIRRAEEDLAQGRGLTLAAYKKGRQRTRRSP